MAPLIVKADLKHLPERDIQGAKVFHFNRSVRLSVRTLGFQPSKTGSTPVPSTNLRSN